MKKTFVALAALAAVGAASAQVSLTGSYTFGYAVDTAAGGSAVGGLLTDGAGIKLTAVEDLGNGVSATAFVSHGGMVRASGSTGGEDAGLHIAGGFGTVKLQTTEGSIDNAMAALNPGYGLDGKVYGSNVTTDSISYTAPAMGGLTLGVSYSDYSTATAGAAGAGGTQGPALSQPSGALSASYAAGGLTVSGTYVVYTKKVISTDAGESKFKLGASYAMGATKVAVAYYAKQYETSSDEKGTTVGAQTAFGPVKLGITYGTFQTKGGGAKKSGYAAGAEYSVSKSVTVTPSFYSYKAASGAANNTGYRVLVSKSF